jgi:hypothetical protein
MLTRHVKLLLKKVALPLVDFAMRTNDADALGTVQTILPPLLRQVIFERIIFFWFPC